MCIAPLEIINPKLDPRSTDPTLLEVGCGKCEECRNQRKDEWIVRTYFQMLHNRERGYYNTFFTLTYSDDCLPHLLIDGKMIPCFNKQDIFQFFKTLKKHLNRRYGINDTNYLVGCEYGDHTQRSHYHIMLGCPEHGTKEDLDPRDLFQFCKNYWKHGFMFPRVFEGGRDSHGYDHKPFLVTGDILAPAQYISKYVCKDLAFYDIPEISSLSDRLDKEEFKKIKGSLPFLTVSRGFGLYLRDVIMKSDLHNIFKYGICFEGNPRRHKIPPYILRKMCYDIDKRVVDGESKVYWKLNEFGKQIRLQNLDNIINSTYTSLYKEFSFINLNSDYMRKFLSEYGYTSSSFRKYIDDLLDGRSFKDLAIYRYLYRNRICLHESGMVIEPGFVSPDSSLTEKRVYTRFFKHTLYNSSIPVMDIFRDHRGEKYKSSSFSKKFIQDTCCFTYNSLPLFSGFDLILDWYKRMSIFHKKYNLEHRSIQYRYYNYIHQKFVEHVP
ncbi:replication initiator protein [Capybara microvirus Cap3_SP_416]|nr:replication initiator protein [Capybara microvirus Cap3_SP_416]